MKRYISYFKEDEDSFEINQNILDYLKHQDARKLLQTIANSLEKDGKKQAAKKLMILAKEV